MKKRITGIFLTLCMMVSLISAMSIGASAASAYITSSSDSRITSMLSAIDAQNFSGTGTNAENAKTVIRHFIYDSSFAALNNGKFPYPNNGSNTSYISDGTYGTNIYAARGCCAYCYYLSDVIYGGEGSRRGEAYQTADTLKALLQTYGQAGDHIRVDNTHSVTFISCDDSGFYCLSYRGDGTGYIRLDYWTYSGFVNNYSGKKIWLYDANTAANAGGGAVQSEPAINSVNRNMIVSVGSGYTLRMCETVRFSSAQVANISNGATIYVYGFATQQYEGANWAKASYNGRVGWVHSDYLVNPAPQLSVVSSSSGEFPVNIPANYKLMCNSGAAVTDNYKYISAKSSGYTIWCDQRLTMSDGTVRYHFVSGDGYSLYFVFTSSMSASQNFTVNFNP